MKLNNFRLKKLIEKISKRGVENLKLTDGLLFSLSFSQLFDHFSRSSRYSWFESVCKFTEFTSFSTKFSEDYFILKIRGPVYQLLNIQDPPVVPRLSEARTKHETQTDQRVGNTEAPEIVKRREGEARVPETGPRARGKRESSRLSERRIGWSRDQVG